MKVHQAGKKCSDNRKKEDSRDDSGVLDMKRQAVATFFQVVEGIEGKKKTLVTPPPSLLQSAKDCLGENMWIQFLQFNTEKG